MGFVRSLEDGSTRRAEPWSWGTAHFNDLFPLKWDLNFLRIEDRPTSLEVSAVVAEAETIFERGGFDHRKIHDDDERGAELVPAFRKLGWETETIEVMVLDADPALSSDVRVEEVSSDEIRVPTLEWYRQTLVISEEGAQNLADSVEAVEAAVDVRYFAVRSPSGRIVSWCHLYMDGDLAQVEEVSTFERFRKRGYARATVARAIHEARRAGASFIFLMADANDWPKEMYARLGFRPVGRIYEYSRLPRFS